ncbi:MAG: cytochrome c3 family protein [Thermodesulfobacteriota bacterium]|nr:cytochrome c3 family protein [Thermodesulfobacteriota bacterium]
MKRIFVLIVSFMFLGSGIAFAGTFTDSAHGNSSSGVKRKNPFPSEYSRGNCAHCHEQHASIGGDEPTPDANKAQGPDSFCSLANNWSGLPTVKPYVQDDNSCFYCHTSSATFQALPAFFNYSYCRTFGGYSSDAAASIMDTFNLTSYHNLYDLYRYITGQSGSGSHPSFTDFPASSSPCSGCHNVHIAKRNKATPGNSSNTAISRPSDHNNLWGDGSPGERMTATGYSADYQPPQYYSSSNLEPDGTSSDRATQAGKTPDYNTFCIDCHNSTNTIWSTSLSRNLKTIDWDVEKHGKGDADGYITVDSPYTSGSGDLGYVLSCLDCHEPHGSSNAFLIRKEVNGAALGATISYGTDADKLDNANWDYLCNRCHQDDAELHSGCEADNYGEIHHSTTYGGDPPYTTDIQNCGGCHSFTVHNQEGYSCTNNQAQTTCTNCHYHGSEWSGRPAF